MGGNPLNHQHHPHNPKYKRVKIDCVSFCWEFSFNFFPLFYLAMLFLLLPELRRFSRFVSHLAGLALICTSIENSKSLLPLPPSSSAGPPPPYLTATLFFKRFNSFFSCCCCCGGWERVAGEGKKLKKKVYYLQFHCLFKETLLKFFFIYILNWENKKTGRELW